MGMRETYGSELRFIGFDVLIGNRWLSVPDMAQVLEAIGIECVPYTEVTTISSSWIARKIFPAKSRRVALAARPGTDPVRVSCFRPPIEVTKNNGVRIVAKHKGAAFAERATPQKVIDPAQIEVLARADAIAQEWVTPMRLRHTVDKIAEPRDMTAMPRVIRAMIEDVYREGAGEVVESKAASAAIGKRTAGLFKEWVQSQFRESAG